MKTNLDIHLAAAATAQQSLALKDDLAIDSLVLESFAAQSGQAPDYDFFKSEFARLRNTYHTLAGQPAPSTKAVPVAAPATAQLTGKSIVIAAAAATA